jgi:hypothetical protein
MQMWQDAGSPRDLGASAPIERTAAPDIRAEIVQPIEVEALALRDRMQAMPFAIANQAQLDATCALASALQTKIKTAETQRKRATQPLVAAKREIDSWFKPAIEAYQAAKAICTRAMSDYMIAQNAQRAAALQAGDHTTAMAIAPAQLPAGSHTRRNGWSFRVTTPAAVPREFLAVDAARVQAVVNEQREKTAIPGIEAFELEPTIVVRGAA